MGREREEKEQGRGGGTVHFGTSEERGEDRRWEVGIGCR